MFGILFVMTKYFLYARKSTDEPDRQILSIEAQIAELREFAAREHLDIVDTLIESQTAKEPGRPIFNDMLSRIEKGEAQGNLSWHPDRFARNSVDGGKIIYLIDLAKIRELKFCTFWFEPTPQGKFMLNIAFGQSKYYVDNLSENVKRGLRQKVRRGEYPGVAPTGYLNDKLNHKMIIDPQRYRLVQKVFELYATGYHSFKTLRDVITKEGLLSRSQKILTYSNIQMLLNNPFYYGAFKFNGELYEGKHEPAITKKLFDTCQEVMKQRAHPMKRGEKLFVFRNLLTCGECNCAITAEQKFKYQKNGNTHEYIYYRCTKKHGYCSQPFIREELLASQIDKEIQKVSLPQDWADTMLSELDKQEQDSAQSSALVAQNLKEEISSIETKLDSLLDAHLEKTITVEEYTAKKNKLLASKITLDQKLKDFERKGDRTLELTRKFISSAKQAMIVSTRDNLEEKRKFFQKLGSNPRLNRREIQATPRGAWLLLTDSYPHFRGGDGIFADSGIFSKVLGDLDLNQDKRLQRALSYH